MANLFHSPSGGKLPKTPEPVEPIEEIGEDEAEVARKEKRKLLRGGRRATILSGITQALKKRLGE